MTDTMVGAAPSKANWLSATAQIGTTARLCVGTPPGICAMVPVTIRGWAPAWGNSRWAVEDEYGVAEVVDARRLVLPATPPASGEHGDGRLVP